MALGDTWTLSQSESLDEGLAGSTPHRSSALSNKLSSVLSASYADSEIRNALQTLDERNVKNTPAIRRRLRIDAQKEVIDRNAEVIHDFGQVAEQLKRIGTTIASLNHCFEHMKQQVAAARRENAPVLEEANLLLEQKKELETKTELLNAFNKHFIVLEDDLSVLTSSSEMVDDTFFAVLQRVRKIHGDCQALLGSENQRLGVELMEQCSRHLNMGYQKLYGWIQKEFRNISLESPQINSRIRRGLRALSEKPSLFQGCLDFFAEARERVLTDAFYAALTGSDNAEEHDRKTKPIEFYAHDPLRYVGDMLAWTHSATVSEREALENLFVSEGEEFKKGFEAGREAEPWSLEDSEGFNGQKALSDLVNRDVAGVAKALRQRIEQALQHHEDPVLLYKIGNLINFYHVTFNKLLGPRSSLLDTLTALEESSFQHFRTISSETVASINSDVSSPNADLSTPDFLDERLAQLAELLKSFDASLNPSESRSKMFESVIQTAFDPFISACEKMAKSAPDPDSHIFLTNCFLAAQPVLAGYDFVQHRLSELLSQYKTRIANLTEYQHAFFLHTSGLHPLLVALAPLAGGKKTASSKGAPNGDSSAQSTDTEDNTEEEEGIKNLDETLRKAANELPALKPHSLSDTAQALDDFLPSALMDAMENLKRLSSKDVAQEITAEGAERFCEDFEYVECKLAAIDEARTNGRGRLRNDDDGSDRGERQGGEADGDDDVVLLRSLFPRTSGEIRVLLS